MNARALRELCDEIRADLEGRSAALSDAVRRYPTPIARCDEQLAGLLESRAEVLRLLDCAAAPDGDRALVEAFATAAARWDDAAAARLRARAEEVIAGR
ncbi:MAG TPA: hypothetical protein VLC47_14610 [Burkholderiales bacterium]|nr:hypothetical protein [Burkholderiales bacterium]